MDKVVRVGLGVMIRNGDKILLGHRSPKRNDTGGIQEPDCWALPGGKQEMFETMFESAKREIKEETNLDIDELIFLKIFSGKGTYREYPNRR